MTVDTQFEELLQTLDLKWNLPFKFNLNYTDIGDRTEEFYAYFKREENIEYPDQLFDALTHKKLDVSLYSNHSDDYIGKSTISSTLVYDSEFGKILGYQVDNIINLQTLIQQFKNPEYKIVTQILDSKNNIVKETDTIQSAIKENGKQIYAVQDLENNIELGFDLSTNSCFLKTGELQTIHEDYHITLFGNNIMGVMDGIYVPPTHFNTGAHYIGIIYKSYITGEQKEICGEVTIPYDESIDLALTNIVIESPIGTFTFSGLSGEYTPSTDTQFGIENSIDLSAGPYELTFKYYSQENPQEYTTQFKSYSKIYPVEGSLDDIRRKIYIGNIEIEKANYNPLNKDEINLLTTLKNKGYTYLCATPLKELYAFTAEKDSDLYVGDIVLNEKGHTKGWYHPKYFGSSSIQSLGHKINAVFTPLQSNSQYLYLKLNISDTDFEMIKRGFIPIQIK